MERSNISQTFSDFLPQLSGNPRAKLWRAMQRVSVIGIDSYNFIAQLFTRGDFLSHFGFQSVVFAIGRCQTTASRQHIDDDFPLALLSFLVQRLDFVQGQRLILRVQFDDEIPAQIVLVYSTPGDKILVFVLFTPLFEDVVERLKHRERERLSMFFFDVILGDSSDLREKRSQQLKEDPYSSCQSSLNVQNICGFTWLRHGKYLPLP